MFEKNKKPTGGSSNGGAKKSAPAGMHMAAIGPGVKINGRINSDEDLSVEGDVEGSIISEAHEISVAVSGTLKADVRAKVVQVHGTVTGDIVGTEKVIVSQSGIVTGNIDAPRVVLEDGAKFKGSIQMDPTSAIAPAQSHEKSVAPKGDTKDGKLK